MEFRLARVLCVCSLVVVLCVCSVVAFDAGLTQCCVYLACSNGIKERMIGINYC